MSEGPQRISWPPRLVAALFDGPRPFQGAAFLALDNLTVLLGANGAGKTTTLRLLEAHLPKLASRGAEASNDLVGTDCSFFVQVTQEQLAALVADALRSDQSVPPGDVAIQLRSDAEANFERVGPIRFALHQMMKEAAASSLPAAAFDRLESSRILRVSRGPTSAAARIDWCLDFADALELDLIKKADEPTGRPIAFACLGTTTRTMLPTAVAVPRDLDEIRVELREAMLDVMTHLRWGERDRWARDRSVPTSDAPDRRGTKAWLKNPEAEMTTVEPDARSLCALVSQLATALAPAFVSDVHRVRVTVEPLHEWNRGGPGLRFELERPGGIRYPMTRAADGHKVWLQLALLESVAVLRRYLSVLEALLERPADVREASIGNAKDAWRRYDAAADLLRAFGRPNAAPDLTQFLSLRNVGHRLYLIDEPEQHLHPRLQRSAARWLVEAGTAGASQCLVVTHSPHYLRIPGRVAFAYLQQTSLPQDAPKSVIRVLTPELLAATDDVAHEMGFDRGELLSAVSTILFVEGQADKMVLDAYAGARFHHAGIALVPIHGAVSAERKGVVDSEVVLSWTAAKLAVLLDNLVETEWRMLVEDADYRYSQSRKPDKTELKAMADILMRAEQVGRSIAPVGIPVDDIFDLLDDDLLIERYPSFPGHAVARAGHAVATGKHRVNWKTYYKEQFGIVVEPELFGQIGAEMARTGRTSAPLEALIDSLVELAETP